ncbi:hypothetical protein Bca101_005615 [Brassica carinata]
MNPKRGSLMGMLLVSHDPKMTRCALVSIHLFVVCEIEPKAVAAVLCRRLSSSSVADAVEELVPRWSSSCHASFSIKLSDNSSLRRISSISRRLLTLFRALRSPPQPPVSLVNSSSHGVHQVVASPDQCL